MMMPGSSHGTRAIGTTPEARIACSIGSAVGVVERAVLQVDGEAVVALRRHDLGGEGDCRSRASR